MRQLEKLIFVSCTFCPERYRSPSMIRLSSSTILRLRSTNLSLVLGKIAIRWADPSGLMSLNPRLRSRIDGWRSIPRNNNFRPESPIPFPVKFRLCKELEERIPFCYIAKNKLPAVMYSTPFSCNSLYSRFNFFRLAELSIKYCNVGPTLFPILFFPISIHSNEKLLFRINSAPSDWISFSASLNPLNVLFCFSDWLITSAPFTPMSLSWSFKTFRYLLWMKSAAIHFAPVIPMEFFRIELPQTPRSSFS